MQGRLDLYYTVLVVLSVLNVLFSIAVARFYKYKKVSRSWRSGLVQRGADPLLSAACAPCSIYGRGCCKTHASK